MCVCACAVCSAFFCVELLMCKNISNSDRPCYCHRRVQYTNSPLILVKTKTNKTIWLLPPLASHTSLWIAVGVRFSTAIHTSNQREKNSQRHLSGEREKKKKKKKQKSNKTQVRSVWAWARMQWQSVLQCFNNHVTIHRRWMELVHVQYGNPKEK